MSTRSVLPLATRNWLVALLVSLAVFFAAVAFAGCTIEVADRPGPTPPDPAILECQPAGPEYVVISHYCTDTCNACSTEPGDGTGVNIPLSGCYAPATTKICQPKCSDCPGYN